MVKFHFTDWSGKKHTKTSKKAGACSYSYEGGVLVVRDYYTNNTISKLNIPAGWRMTGVERI